MNEEKRIENKKSDNKALIIFIPCLIASCFVGFWMSGMGFFVRDNWAEVISDGLVKGLTLISPYANLVMNTVSITICCVVFLKVKKMIKSMDGDDDELYEKIDRKLSFILALCNFVFILSYFFFAAGYEYCIIGGRIRALEIICYFSGFIIALGANLVITARTVNMYKEMNPEKQGSVFSFNFDKQWENSCDEAERLKIYKSAYKSHIFCNTFYVILWLFCLIGNQIWHFGLMPSVILIVAWLVQFISYQSYAAYYSKHPNKV